MAAARAEVDALYTPLDEVLEELKRRRADAQLVARVAEFHRLSPPTFMPAKPCAVLCRAVTSATFEVERFAGIVRDTHLQPLLLEGHGDTYASRNRDKYRLCRPSFIIDAHTVRSLRIVKLLQLEGKTVWLDMVRTRSGISLMNWHSALLRLLAPALVDCVADGTEWFAKRIRGPLFYLAFLALFVTEGILFENFLVSDADEMRFTRARVIPSFERAVELFGVRPLIVRLLPVDSEDSHHWQCSPGWLHERAKALTSGGSNGQ